MVRHLLAAPVALRLQGVGGGAPEDGMLPPEEAVGDHGEQGRGGGQAPEASEYLLQHRDTAAGSF